MLNDIPRGVEVLVKKAAVDPSFKKLLLERRAEAAEAIALTLSPAEEAMLAAVPEAQLRAIVASTKVSPSLRPAWTRHRLRRPGPSSPKLLPSPLRRRLRPMLRRRRARRLPGAPSCSGPLA